MLLKDYLAKTGLSRAEMHRRLQAVEPALPPVINGSRNVERHADGTSKPDIETMRRYKIATNGAVTPDDWLTQHEGQRT